MEGHKDDLSTHLRWFRNRNRNNFVNGHQTSPINKKDGENNVHLFPSLSSLSSLLSGESSWLRTTLSELHEKTQTMLKLIEEDDADSFAKRAEMYYKRRPQLIHMVHDFHRAHRSLAERYQLVRSKKNLCMATDTQKILINQCETELSTTSSYCDPVPVTSSSSSISEEDDVKSYPDSSSSSFCCSFSGSSCDPDEDQGQLKQEEEAARAAASDAGKGDHEEEVVVVGRDEMESLVEENKKLKEQLMQKDEEKREVIRQLCFSLDLLRNENEDLMALVMMRKDRQNHHHDNGLNLSDIPKTPSCSRGGCFFNV